MPARKSIKTTEHSAAPSKSVPSADVELLDSAETSTKSVVTKARKIDPEDYVTVRNNTCGTLIYVSSRQMGYSVQWDHFGDAEEIKFGELQAMRNSQRRFFEDNWVFIDDPEVLKALGVEKYYKNAVNADNISVLFKMDPDSLKARLSGMSDGMKENVKLKAVEMYQSGELDSMKVMRVLESVLDFKFQEI